MTLAFLAALLTGCVNHTAEISGSQASEIVVFAAASLTESMTELAETFESQEGNRVKVVLNFAGSQNLKTSIESGTKADIFASASIKYMDELKNKGFVEDYRVFLKNRLVIIKNLNSKYSIKELKDLSADGLKLAVGDKSVPVGSYWEKAFEKAFKDGIINGEEKAGIENNVKTREVNVKHIVSKVLLNEVDAGIVYKTDVTVANSGKIEEISVPLFDNFEAGYPVAILKGSERRSDVKKFYNYILCDKGKEVFKKYRFSTE